MGTSTCHILIQLCNAKRNVSALHEYERHGLQRMVRVNYVNHGLTFRSITLIQWKKLIIRYGHGRRSDETLNWQSAKFFARDVI